MPLLEDVFKRYPKTLINIEIKTPLEENIYLVNDLIVMYKLENNIIWGCKNATMSKKLKEVNPNIKIFFSTSSVIEVVKFLFLGTFIFIILFNL